MVTRWRDQAACLDADPNLFVLLLDAVDPDPSSRWKEAVKHCEVCPVRGECLEEGTRNRLDGIWGGKLLSLGHVETRTLVPPKCQSCGNDLAMGRNHHTDKWFCSKACEEAAQVPA